MGKGKGGGSSVKAPVVGVNPGINQVGGIFQNLGTYGSETMSGLGSLGNWATNLATGGNVQVNGTMPANGILANTGSNVFAPFTSGSTGTGGGGWGLSGLNSQEMGPFLTQAVQDLLQAQHATGPLKQLLKLLPGQAQSEFNQANQFFGAGGDLLNTGQQITASGADVFNQGGRMLDMATYGTGLFPTQQAYLNQAVNTQQNEIAQQLANAGLSMSTQKAQLLGQVSMSGAAAAGQLIQGNIQAANQTMGVGISQEQAGFQQQQLGIGEQQLGTTEQQIAQDTQKIDLAAQEALFTQFSTISQLSSGLQSQLWTEGLQGYGMLGQFMQNTMAAFGQDLKAQEDVQNVMLANAGFQLDAARINQGAQQAAASGFSSMLGSLGGLLGSGSGGSSGGLLGGLGGLLTGGGGAGAAGGLSALDSSVLGGSAATVLGGTGAGAAAGGGGLLAGLGSAIGGIGAAISAIFSASCTAGRGVPGVNDIRWVLFRDWILYRSPRLIRTFYVRHCEWINRTISERPWLRKTVLFLVDQVVTHDQNTRTA